MLANQCQAVPGDFPDDRFESAIVLRPCFDFRDEIHGHVNGGRFAFVFIGQMPARLGTARAFEGSQVALDQWPQLAKLGQGGLPPRVVPVASQNGRIHFNIKTYLLI